MKEIIMAIEERVETLNSRTRANGVLTGANA